MSRCRACDKVLNEKELKARNPHTGDWEDFCYECRAASIGIPLENMDELEALDFIGTSGWFGKDE